MVALELGPKRPSIGHTDRTVDRSGVPVYEAEPNQPTSAIHDDRVVDSEMLEGGGPG